MLYREIIAVFFSDPYRTHKHTVLNIQLLNVKLVVHIVTTGLYKG